MADNKFHTGLVLQNMERLKTEMPTILANHAQKYFVASWQRNGWEGQQWAEPQRKIEGTKEWKYPLKGAKTRRTRHTLVKTGALRRAVGMSIRNVSFEKTTLVVGLPYAAVHNEGSESIPKRQYMGDSQYLRAQQTKKINDHIERIWQV